MRKIVLLLITALFACTSFGQDRKDLVVSFSTGWLSSMHYQTARARSYYSADFDYHVAKKHILSANFNAGKHDYYDKVLSNVPASPETPTNAEANYRTFSILYKYQFLNEKGISAQIGGGVGIMTHIQEYQYQEPNRGDVRQAAWTNLVFPLRVDLDYRLSRRFKLGAIGGLFIHPEESVLAYNIGPRLGFIID